MKNSDKIRKSLGCAGSVPLKPVPQKPSPPDGETALSGSYCDYCGEWIPIGLLSVVKHFEKSERCMVNAINDGMKREQPMIAGPKVIATLNEVLESVTHKPTPKP